MSNLNPLQYPLLENPMHRGAWWATVCGVTKSQTQNMHRSETGLWALYVFLLSIHMFQIQAYDLFYTWRHWCWGCLVSNRGWIQTHSTKLLSFWRKWPSKLSGGKVRKKSDVSTKTPQCLLHFNWTDQNKETSDSWCPLWNWEALVRVVDLGGQVASGL